MDRFKPIEIETIKVKLRAHDGNESISSITLFDISSVPPFNDRCKITFSSSILETQATGFCFFGAFQGIRLRLESKGITPLVNAALENCYPSGMASDMGGGMRIYKLTKGIRSELTDLVPTFGECHSGNFATVDKQKQFYLAWQESVANAT